MRIEIRHTEKVKEGTLIYALVPELERPLTPHYIVGDTEEVKQQKRDIWKEEVRKHNKKQKEIKLLHLGDAELLQKDED